MDADQTIMRAPRGKKTPLLAALVILLIAGLAAGLWQYRHHNNSSAASNASPIPPSISQAVNFPIYYPDQKKLPAGYSLDLSSIKSPVENGVTYSISYGNNRKIVFSLQPKPSEAELQTFNANYIPLRNDFQTPLGQAEIGAYNNRGTTETFISLPTNGTTWLIITAPYNTDQNKLKQVLDSLKQ